MGIGQKEKFSLETAAWKLQLSYGKLWSWDNPSEWSQIEVRWPDLYTSVLFSNWVKGLSSTTAVSLQGGLIAEGCLSTACPVLGNLSFTSEGEFEWHCPPWVSINKHTLSILAQEIKNVLVQATVIPPQVAHAYVSSGHEIIEKMVSTYKIGCLLHTLCNS